MDERQLVEALADAEHTSWARRMAHLFTQGKQQADGSFTLPGEYVNALQRQIATPYSDLTELEKAHDLLAVGHLLLTIQKFQGEGD
jgi:hypothetical protein